MHRRGTRNKAGASRRVCYKRVKRTDLGVTCTLYFLFNISLNKFIQWGQRSRGEQLFSGS